MAGERGYSTPQSAVVIDGLTSRYLYELREPEGTVLFRDGLITLLVPTATDFPVESGVQLQVTNSALQTHEHSVTPLLSENADPKEMLRTVAVSLAAESVMLHYTNDAWVNLNAHSRPPVTAERPVSAQYAPFTVDIHGRSKDPLNWGRPPATNGVWGTQREMTVGEEIALTQDSLDDNGRVVPATADEIKRYKQDPMSRVWGETPLDPGNPDDFIGWETHPTGMYHWDGQRSYTGNEPQPLNASLRNPLFRDLVKDVQHIPLFLDEQPEDADFEPNATDIELWRFGGYQLVTQRTPLTDPKDGIHMVVKLRPEPHTPWENPQQTLEAFAIGIGVARLLRDTETMGEMGDVYLDMNANWSMHNKKQRPDETIAAFKKRIQEDTRAHLHVQLEKVDRRWEIPPAPDTFRYHRVQPETTIAEIRTILNDPENGLTPWLMQHCRGTLVS